MTQLPSGLRGVVMAGALAAAMSTLDSNVNAISYCIVTDLARAVWWRGKTEQQCVTHHITSYHITKPRGVV